MAKSKTTNTDQKYIFILQDIKTEKFYVPEGLYQIVDTIEGLKTQIINEGGYFSWVSVKFGIDFDINALQLLAIDIKTLKPVKVTIDVTYG